VSRIVVLDSGPLGLATNPRPSVDGDACNQWMRSLLANGARLIVPEIVDYELRRELLRASKMRGLGRLETVTARLEYLPITTAAMRKAAELWAEARNRGLPTADPRALDGDAILAGQVLSLGNTDAIVATTNVDHLVRFVPAAEWRAIQP
jgi:predicted nucleic acid-binding protein